MSLYFLYICESTFFGFLYLSPNLFFFWREEDKVIIIYRCYYILSMKSEKKSESVL